MITDDDKNVVALLIEEISGLVFVWGRPNKNMPSSPFVTGNFKGGSNLPQERFYTERPNSGGYGQNYGYNYGGTGPTVDENLRNVDSPRLYLQCNGDSVTECINILNNITKLLFTGYYGDKLKEANMSAVRFTSPQEIPRLTADEYEERAYTDIEMRQFATVSAPAYEMETIIVGGAING